MYCTPRTMHIPWSLYRLPLLCPRPCSSAWIAPHPTPYPHTHTPHLNHAPLGSSNTGASQNLDTLRFLSFQEFTRRAKRAVFLCHPDKVTQKYATETSTGTWSCKKTGEDLSHDFKDQCDGLFGSVRTALAVDCVDEGGQPVISAADEFKGNLPVIAVPIKVTPHDFMGSTTAANVLRLTRYVDRDRW